MENPSPLRAGWATGAVRKASATDTAQRASPAVKPWLGSQRVRCIPTLGKSLGWLAVPWLGFFATRLLQATLLVCAPGGGHAIGDCGDAGSNMPQPPKPAWASSSPIDSVRLLAGFTAAPVLPTAAIDDIVVR